MSEPMPTKELPVLKDEKPGDAKLGNPQGTDGKYSETKIKEIEAMEKENKKLLAALLASDVWTAESEELQLLKLFDPKKKYYSAKYLPESGDFSASSWNEMSGAEYRHAFLIVATYANTKKLEADDVKKLNQHLFGQDTRPEPKKETDPVKAKELRERLGKGNQKLKDYAILVTGELMTRPRIEPKKEAPKKEEPKKADPIDFEKGLPFILPMHGPGSTFPPTTEKPKKDDKPKGDLPASDAETSLQRNGPAIIAAIDRMNTVLEETTDIDANMANALIAVSESQLADAINGTRPDGFSVPFKSVARIDTLAKKSAFVAA